MSEINVIVLIKHGQKFLFTFEDDRYADLCREVLDLMWDEELPEFGANEAFAVLTRAQRELTERQIKNGVFNARAFTEEV